MISVSDLWQNLRCCHVFGKHIWNKCQILNDGCSRVSTHWAWPVRITCDLGHSSCSHRRQTLKQWREWKPVFLVLLKRLMVCIYVQGLDWDMHNVPFFFFFFFILCLGDNWDILFSIINKNFAERLLLSFSDSVSSWFFIFNLCMTIGLLNTTNVSSLMTLALFKGRQGVQRKTKISIFTKTFSFRTS